MLGNVDQHHRREEPFEIVLEQQWDVLDDHRCPALDSLGGALRHPVPDERMHDVVQPPPRVRISEDQLAKALAVDPAILHVALAELPDDRIESRRTRLVDGVRGFVGVDDDRPLLAKHLGHRRLPRASPSRQANQLHETEARRALLARDAAFIYDLPSVGDEEKFDAIVVGAGPSRWSSSSVVPNQGPRMSWAASSTTITSKRS